MIIARHTISAIPRPILVPIPALAELLNPAEVGIGVGFTEGVDCKDPVRNAEAAEVNTPLIVDPVKVEDVETAALDDEVVLDGRLYPASE